MNRRLLSFMVLATLALGPAARSLTPAYAQSQTETPLSSFRAAQASADKAGEADKAAQEEDAYTSGQDALGEGEYDKAVKAFDSVVGMHGKKADAAMYWMAYSLNKAGNKPRAQAVLNDLRKSYPQSRWLQEASALDAEMRGATSVDVSGCNDEETKLIALNALMDSDPERALPILDKIIHGNCSTKMKDKALFVLAQSNSEKAQQILLSLAKANNDPNLQSRAIRYIGMNGTSANRAILREIYNSATDANVKKAVFKGWLMCGGKEDVLAVARTEKSPELRKEAIHYLGLMGGRTELREMYKSSPDAETREAVVHAMMLNGDAEGLGEIVNVEKDPNVLASAIKTLGLIGGEDSLRSLVNIYNSHSDIESKEQVINALFLHNAGKEMVELARKETNPELKRALISKMSLMKSPEITQYMIEILNK
jgi:HEAT repeat protein